MERNARQERRAFQELIRVVDRARMRHQETQRRGWELLVGNGLLRQLVGID